MGGYNSEYTYMSYCCVLFGCHTTILLTSWETTMWIMKDNMWILVMTVHFWSILKYSFNLQSEKKREIEQIRRKDEHFYPWLANVSHFYLKLHFNWRKEFLETGLVRQLTSFKMSLEGKSVALASDLARWGMWGFSILERSLFLKLVLIHREE